MRVKKNWYSTDCVVLMHITLGRADFDMWIWDELFSDHRRLMDCSVTSAQCLRCSWAEICNYHHSTRPRFGTHNTTENVMFYTYSKLTTSTQSLAFMCVYRSTLLCIIWCPYTRAHALLSAILFLCLFVAQTSVFTSKPSELSASAQVVTQRLYSRVTDSTRIWIYHLQHPQWNPRPLLWSATSDLPSILVDLSHILGEPYSSFHALMLWISTA